MPGKYDGVVEGLPRLLESDIDKIRDFAERSDKYRGMTATGIAAKWVEFRDEKDGMEDLLSETERELAVLRVLFIKAAAAEGIDGVKLASGRAVSHAVEPHATVEDPEKFRVWCIENDLERSLRLMPQTTEALTRERLLAGLAPPPGVKIWLRDKLTLRRG